MYICEIYTLYQGLKVAGKLFPEGLISGPLPESITGQRPASNPLPVPSAHPSRFSREDIDKIEIYLDNALQDHSIGSKCTRSCRISCTDCGTVSIKNFRMVSLMEVTYSMMLGFERVGWD